MEFDRHPTSFKGKVASALFKVAGAKIYGKQLRETLHRLEEHDARAGTRTLH